MAGQLFQKPRRTLSLLTIATLIHTVSACSAQRVYEVVLGDRETYRVSLSAIVVVIPKIRTPCRGAAVASPRANAGSSFCAREREWVKEK